MAPFNVIDYSLPLKELHLLSLSLTLQIITIPRNFLEFMRALQSAREYKIVENENVNECGVNYHFESLWLDKN